MSASEPSKTSRSGNLQQWHRFLRSESHILRQRPQLLFQQASNQPSISHPCFTAQQVIDKGLETRPWLRRVNKRNSPDRCLLVLSGTLDRVTCCDFSPDGRQAVSGDENHMIKLWDVVAGMEIGQFEGHTDHVQDCKFSPDGKLLVSCSLDDTVRLWDVNSGRQIASLSEPEMKYLINACDFSPDGTLVVAGGSDSKVRIWKAASGEFVKALGPFKGAIEELLFSPDGKLLLVGYYTDILLIDLATAAPIHTLSSRYSVRTCRFSPDGKWIVSGSELWDARAGTLVTKLLSDGIGYHSVAFSPDGRMLALGSDEGVIHIWDFVERQLKLNLPAHSSWVTALAFSPDARTLLSGSFDASLKLWDTENLEQHTEPPFHSGSVRACRFSPSDENQLVVVHEHGDVVTIDCQSGEEIRTVHKPHSGYYFAFAPDWSRVYSARAIASCETTIWQRPNWSEDLTAMGPIEFPFVIECSPDNLHIAWGGSSGQMAMTDTNRLDVAQWKPKGGGNSNVCCGAFSHDGATLAMGGAGGSVDVWKVADSGKPLFLSRHHGPVMACAFSPDDRLLVSGDDKGQLIVWNLVTPDTPSILSAHRKGIRACAFSPDGRLLATVSEDHTLKLWDVVSQVPVAEYWTGDSLIKMDWHPNGSKLAVGAEQGEFHLLELRNLPIGASKLPVLPQTKKRPELWKRFAARLWRVVSKVASSVVCGNSLRTCRQRIS